MKRILKTYRSALILASLLVLTSLIDSSFTSEVVGLTIDQLTQMLLVIPPIFVLLGLLDVWVSKETLTRHMGERSGVKGVILALLLGSAAAGPLYGAFPIAAVFMKKGVSFSNVLIFIGAWSTTKIPMFLFELFSLGTVFAVTRLLVDIPGIILISRLITALMPKEEVELIYEKARKL